MTTESMTCPTCHGDGNDITGIYDHCHACDGTGQISSPALPSAPAVEGVERELVERLRAPHSIDTWHAAQEATSAISRLTSLLTTATDEFAALRDASTKEISRLTALLAEADAVVKP